MSFHGLKPAKEWLPLGLAATYVLGFVIVGLHLAGYGASSLDLIKAQYLAAGFWFCLIFVAYFATLKGIRSLMTKLGNGMRRPGFQRGNGAGYLLNALFANVFLIGAGIVVVYSFRFNPPFEGSAEITSRVVRFSVPFVVLMAFLDVAIQLRQWSERRIGDQSLLANIWTMTWAVTTFLAIFLFLLAVFTFSVTLYRIIPFSLGGGQPRQVIFWLGEGNGNGDAFLERDDTSGYSVPYELLVENESSLIVISPKEGQRAIEFDRKAVGAVVVLGKRSVIAPAHFQRGLTEGGPAR